MADFYVTAIKKTPDNKYIMSFKARANKFDKDNEFNRQQLIDWINAGKVVNTLIQEGFRFKELEVITVVLNREEYIKINPDNKKVDNLDYLPNF
jgi:hypothetical protein